VTIHFYSDTVDFIRDNALEHSPFSESQLPPEMSLQNLDSKLAIHIANTRTGYGYPSEFRLSEIAFKSGTIFKISDETSIAELVFEGRAACKFQTPFRHSVFVEEGYTAQFASSGHYEPLFASSGYHEPLSPQNVDQLLKFRALISARFRSGRLVAWEIESFKSLEP
jgi:hypothetical protein